MTTAKIIIDGADLRRQENVLRLFCDDVVQLAVLDTGDPCAEWSVTTRDHHALARLLDRLSIEEMTIVAMIA